MGGCHFRILTQRVTFETSDQEKNDNEDNKDNEDKDNKDNDNEDNDNEDNPDNDNDNDNANGRACCDNSWTQPASFASTRKKGRKIRKIKN